MSSPSPRPAGCARSTPTSPRYLPQAAAAAVVPVLLLAWVATQDWLSFVVVIALVLAVPVTMIYFGREATRRSERQWRRLGSLAGRFLQLVEGLPTLRAFRREAQGRREVAAATEGVRSRDHAHAAGRLPLRALHGHDRRLRGRVRGDGAGPAPPVGGARPADGDGGAAGRARDLHPAAPGGRRVPRQHRGAGGGGTGPRGARHAGPHRGAAAARPGPRAARRSARGAGSTSTPSRSATSTATARRSRPSPSTPSPGPGWR